MAASASADGAAPPATAAVAVSLALDRVGSGRPLLLLHGFPENRYGWRAVAEALGAGWGALLPDQRGYGGSPRPVSAGAYALDRLVADAIGVLDASGIDRAVVAGHDWGGVVGAALAARHPKRVERLLLANAPHPLALREALIEDPDQRAASGYFAALAGAGAEPALLAAGAPALWDRFFGSSPHWAPQRSAMIADWLRPGTLAAMCRWYGDNRWISMAAETELDHGWSEAALFVRVPTLILWGMEDRVLLPHLADRSARFFEQVQIVRVEGAGHGIIHERPSAVAALLRDFAT